MELASPRRMLFNALFAAGLLGFVVIVESPPGVSGPLDAVGWLGGLAQAYPYIAVPLALLAFVGIVFGTSNVFGPGPRRR